MPVKFRRGHWVLWSCSYQIWILGTELVPLAGAVCFKPLTHPFSSSIHKLLMITGVAPQVDQEEDYGRGKNEGFKWYKEQTETC